MLPLLTAFALAASAGPPVCCERAAAFVATKTNIESAHHIGHVISPMILTASFYGTALYLGASRKEARWIAVGLSLAVVVGKELYDYQTAARGFSKQDVALGTASTAVGLWLAESIKWGSRTIVIGR